MSWLLLSLAILVIIFGFVVAFGAPYVPTLQPQVQIALDILDLTKGQIMLELGAGDGKVMVAAAERGIIVVGYELNPILVIVCWLRLRRYNGRAKIIWGNYWRATWPKCDGIFTFGIDRHMEKLDQKINELPYRPLKLASNAFVIPNKKAALEHKGVFLYRYR